MLQAALDGVAFIQGCSRSDLDTDAKLRRALVNAIQEIGEAAVRLSDTGRARLPGIPWPEVVRMRNILVHVYWGMDLDQIWQTARDDLEPLIRAIESALATWPATPNPS
jgi:uncharacterized protein with HEPN domain